MSNKVELKEKDAEALLLEQLIPLLKSFKREAKQDHNQKEEGILDSIWAGLKNLGSSLLDVAPKLAPLLMAAL